MVFTIILPIGGVVGFVRLEKDAALSVNLNAATNVFVPVANEFG